MANALLGGLWAIVVVAVVVGPHGPQHEVGARHPELPPGARPEALPRPLQDPLVPGPTLEGVLAPRHHGEHHRRLHQARGLHALERRLRHQDALLRRVQQPRPRRRHQQEGHLAWVPRHRPEGRRAVHRRAVHRRRVVAQVHRHAAHPRVQVLKTACMAWYIQHTLGRWYIHVCT
ncbi:Pectinesterase 5 [Zea mays]|uniref:Pectinesterase 5 n=1 Tax=Zea mays TaxID=4577 RepID=A0A1D6E978_MAIZE|nr:Pectinesterase 5 [Zea mays]